MNKVNDTVNIVSNCSLKISKGKILAIDGEYFKILVHGYTEPDWYIRREDGTFIFYPRWWTEADEKLS